MKNPILQQSVRRVLATAHYQRQQVRPQVVQKASEFFESEAQLADVLESAESNASAENEMNFVAEMQAKVEQHGFERTWISERQANWLRKIARMT